jgi:cbb3-type cytochrome oxidase maturation protein
MTILYIMVPIAFLLAGGAVLAFIRAATQGQFDDLETPAQRMLLDDESVQAHPTNHAAK